MKRRSDSAVKRLAKKASKMINPGQRSKYARKRAYCLANGVWGFDVREPKPWK